MKRETYIKRKTSGKTSSKQNSQAVKGNGAKRLSAIAETLHRDSAARFVESANEHMLRAWESIHKNGEERKVS